MRSGHAWIVPFHLRSGLLTPIARSEVFIAREAFRPLELDVHTAVRNQFKRHQDKLEKDRHETEILRLKLEREQQLKLEQNQNQVEQKQASNPIKPTSPKQGLIKFLNDFALRKHLGKDLEPILDYCLSLGGLKPSPSGESFSIAFGLHCWDEQLQARLSHGF